MRGRRMERQRGAGFLMSERERTRESVEGDKKRERLNGISDDEWAIIHCLLASCADYVSMVIISI